MSDGVLGLQNGHQNGADGQTVDNIAEELWRHKDPKSTAMWHFLEGVNKKYNLNLQSYVDLYAWSVEHIAAFWEEVWHFTGVVASEPFKNVVDENAPMYPRPPFFSGARLNFAQNLLYPPVSLDPNSPAIIAATETLRETISWANLRSRVESCQLSLKALGVKENDRVAGFVGNHINGIVAMLAVTSLGAVYSGVSPDSGPRMVIDRLTQIEPCLLFADDGQFYNGKRFEVLSKVEQIAKAVQSIKLIVVFDVVGESVEGLKVGLEGKTKIIEHENFLSLGKSGEHSFEFVQLPPDHPVYILYSSGTTGAPKCIVHGAIGTLIQHKKEHILHCSIKPGERVFYYTTATWMMWHWLISGLAAGATLILYDGSPMRYRSPAYPETTPATYTSVPDDLAMPRLISELSIHHFGTSAKYLSLLEQKSLFPLQPPHNIPLPSLLAIYNTASPLSPSTFRYVYRAFGPSLNLGSITGGTDIISLFGAPCPLLPVHAGQVQCLGLGMAVRAYSDSGSDITSSGEPGDLVCIKAFPCQPVAFWGSDGAAKYRKSYFDRFPGLWHHGDFIVLDPKTHGMTMLGRSDGVLNPAGIRFGSAEIYNVVLKDFAGKVADALCVGRRREGEDDETVVLFLKMEEGMAFDAAVAKEVKGKIREALSARHVPGIVDACPDIPVTVNGKKIEGAVKQIISGSKVQTSASVANPECLEFYQKWAETH